MTFFTHTDRHTDTKRKVYTRTTSKTRKKKKKRSKINCPTKCICSIVDSPFAFAAAKCQITLNINVIMSDWKIDSFSFKFCVFFVAAAAAAAVIAIIFQNRIEQTCTHKTKQ